MENYRQILKHSLQLRKQRLAKYSLRAFARDLNLSSSFLSEVLNGRNRLATETAAEVASRLDLNATDFQRFVSLVEYEHARSAEYRKIIGGRLKEIKQNEEFSELKEDSFRVISDWYHFAIIEILHIDGVKHEVDAIATALNISHRETDDAVNRLERLGLIERREGRWCHTHSPVTTTHDVPNEALRRFHRQLLTQARDALITNDVKSRDFGAVVFAADPTKIEKAKEMICEFRRGLMHFLESGERKELYCFSGQLFRLTKTPLSRRNRKSV